MEGVGFYFVGSPESKISKVEILRALITEKLATAVQDIMAVVETTIVGYDKEVLLLRQELEDHKKQLDTTLQPIDENYEVAYDDDNDNNENHMFSEGALKGDSSLSSEVSPINAEGGQDEDLNHVQKVNRKRSLHMHPSESHPSNSGFVQQPQGQASQCQQNPSDALCSESGADFWKIPERSHQMDITIQMGDSLPELRRCTDCCRDFHCPFCDPNHFCPTIPYRVKMHLRTHFNRSVNHEEFTIHRCGRSCRTDLHYHCLYCAATVLRRDDFMKHLHLCKLGALRRNSFVRS